MAKMISLKRSPAEKKANEEKFEPMAPGGEDYGYGTRIDLDHEALAKHGLDKGPMPKQGDKFEGAVKGHVHEATETTVNGKARRHVTLQVTHLPEGLGLGGGSVREDLEDAAKKASK